MDYEGGEAEGMPPHRTVTHYHGDETRLLFVIAAVVMVVAKSTGTALPLPTFLTVVVAVVLAIAAGITNPKQKYIHWVNFGLAALGALYFGIHAVNTYRAGNVSIFNGAFMYTEILAVASLVALYLTTRTLRGINMRAET